MELGTIVKVKPTAIASEEFRQKVAAYGEVKGEVHAVSNRGVCTLILAKGVEIEGHSHPVPSPDYVGHHYLDINQSHLEPVVCC